MSFRGYKAAIEDGDTVVLFFGFDCLMQMKVVKHKVQQTRYGALKHAALLGKAYGSKIQCSKGWVYVLHPTPELWTVTLPHRTQILYSTDISVITLQLDLKPGSVVVESGTGSGSLSHAIIRTILPEGRLYTFDFHEERVKKAAEEFKDHGIGDFVTCTRRDACKDGFDLEHVADAVFLDLPAPWEVLPFAKKALKCEGGRICSFSPCIEQVQRTCETLAELDFCEIETLECLTRSLDVRSVNMSLPDLGYGPGNYPEFEDVGRTVHQPVIGHIVQASANENEAQNQAADDKEASGNSEDEEKKSSEVKHVKKSEKDVAESLRHKKGRQNAPTEPSFAFKSGLAPLQMPGHTGYLTFATLYPG